MHRFIRQTRDRNHGEIVKHLIAHNVEVIEIFYPLDCLIYSDGRAGWIEIKTTARNADIKRTQIEFMAKTKMPVAFVKTPNEALRFAQTFEGLTEKQRGNLAEFLQDATRNKYHPAVIERVLAWE